jgi:hypothetical protein
MPIYSQEDIRLLQHCIHKVILREPRIDYQPGAKKCGVDRKTFSKYWRKGLDDQILFPPQIRLTIYESRKEYLYLVQSDKAHELYKYYQKQPNVIYSVYTLGKFDLVLQTSKPLEILPDATLLHGSRSSYIYPETPYYRFVTALDKMEALLSYSHQKSCIDVTCPVEPGLEGSQYGWRIFPYVKYNLRTNYTFIVKKLGISFGSFYKGLDYLLKVCTVLLPYYPLGFPKYTQYFFVARSDYEYLVKDFFGLLPCHTSITKIGDVLLIYTSVEKGVGLKERLFDLIHRMFELGYIDRFWASNPVYYYDLKP